MTIAEVCEESIQHLSIHVHPGIPMAYTPFYIQQSQICILTEGEKKLRTFIQQGSPLYTAPRYRLHTLLTLWQGGQKGTGTKGKKLGFLPTPFCVHQLQRRLGEKLQKKYEALQ